MTQGNYAKLQEGDDKAMQAPPERGAPSEVHEGQAASETANGSEAPSEPPSKKEADLVQPTYVMEPGELARKHGFARIAFDVPMMLGSRGGVPIGMLRKGTRVKLYGAPEGGTVTVAAPFPGVHPFGGVRASSDDYQAKNALYVSIESQTSPVGAKKRIVALQGSAGERSYGLYRELGATSSSSEGFAYVKCGAVRIQERKEQRLRVIAEYDAGELYGWVDANTSGERDEGCDFGLQPPLPAGYLRVNPEASAGLIELATHKAEVFLGPYKNEAAKCERWVFVPGKDPLAGWFSREEAGGSDNRTTERPYVVHAGVISLGGLVYRQKEAAVVAGGKVDFFAPVRVSDESLDVLEWEQSSSNHGDSPLIGYRPSSARSWFKSREACEAASNKSSSSKSGKSSKPSSASPARLGF